MNRNSIFRYKAVLVVGILLLMGLNAVHSSTGTINEETIFDTRDGTIKVTIPVGEYEIKKSRNGDELFVEDFGHLLVSGKPNMPSKIVSIAIPPDAEFAGYTYDVTDETILSGKYIISPVPTPRLIDYFTTNNEQQKIYNKNYNEVYRSDVGYPESVVEFVRTAGYRTYNLIDFRINPFTYYPLSGQLIFYPKIDNIL